MIPYDELVVALQTWRAKQGLPVAQLSGALTPPARVAAPPAASPGFAPRTAPPGAPPSRSQGYSTPPPLAMEDSHDIDESALIEEANESEGDFAVGFGAVGRAAPDHNVDDEQTAIGEVPVGRPSDPYGLPTDPGLDTADDTADRPIKSHNRNDDW